ncbi:MAG: DUF3857 domain-containing protein [bacterium]
MFKCFLVSNRVRPMRYGIERFHNPTLTTINTCIIFGIVTILSLFNCQSIFAQEQPVEWGKIPRADLEMADFPDDTNAVAVILADVGKVTFKGDFNIIFERHRRIKILSEGGYEWGSFSIPFYAKKKYQSIDKKDIEGQTFILNTDGSQRHVKLDKASIFDEDIDGKYRRIRFTLPALTPGCVVEYRYRVKSKNPTFLHNWKFQTSEPTRWSEFRADIPSPFNYAMIWQGIKKFDLEESTSYPWPHELKHFRTAKAFHLVINSHRWGMRDMPALREEPFMTTPEDYRAKIRFQLQSTFWPLQAPTLVMHSWQKLAEELMDSKYFGREIERHKVLRKQARSLVADLNNPEEKMLAIYDYVRTTMAWNGEYGIYKDVDLDDAFKARHGGGP